MDIVRSRQTRFADLLILGAISAAALLLAASVAFAPPRDSEEAVALVFAPWTSAERALAQAIDAGARFVRFGGVPFVVVAAPGDAGYAERIRRAGAWLIVDPRAVAACLPESLAKRIQ